MAAGAAHGKRRSRARHNARASLAINLIGAVTTGLALIVIIAAKFTGGAWITMLVIPCVIILLLIVKGTTQSSRPNCARTGR